MADQAYFAQNVVFPGKEHINLTAPEYSLVRDWMLLVRSSIH